MADQKIDPYELGALERSVNDSATRVSGLWLSFVAFSAYLAAAASMISHRQIFLEEPIKLPTINIDLPLVASAILLPLLFVIYHVFVLLQVVLLARTADAYNQALSVRRAMSVKDEMTRQGMDAGGIEIVGKSFHDPLVPTGPGVREPQNRRAVIDLGS